MIYPKKINANKTDKVMKALLIASVVLSAILIIRNININRQINK